MSADTFDIVQGNRETITGTLHDPAATVGDVLTVQADKSIAAKPGSGGGVQVVTVPVSSAEILDLHNTPVVLIPGVAGNVTVVNSAAFAYLAGLVPYLDGGGDILVGTPTTPNAWAGQATAGIWDQAASKVYLQPYGTGPNIGSSSDWDGADIILTETVANPTLGDGTLLVTVSYFLAPVA